MSVRKKLLRGSVFTKSHSSLIKEASFLMRKVKKIPYVEKIVIGEIIPLSVSKRRLKFVTIPAGFRVVTRGVNSQQTFFIYTKNTDLLKQEIEALWGDSY